MRVVLEVLSRLQALPPALNYYVFYFLAATVSAFLYLALWRLAAPAPGARVFAWVAALEGLSALIGIAAFWFPVLFDYIELPKPLPVTGVFDALAIISLGLSVAALVRTGVAPRWVVAVRAGSLALLIMLDVVQVFGVWTPASSSTPLWVDVVSYTIKGLGILFWVGLGLSLLRRRGEAEVSPNSTVVQMAAIVLVGIMILAVFPFLVAGTIGLFHVFNLDLAINLAAAAIAYGVLWAVGASLDKRYRALADAAFADPYTTPTVPQSLSDAYGLLLVCLLPFLVYLLVFALYAVELFVTEVLVLGNAIEFMPLIVLGAVAVVALGSAWGVLLGFWRLFVPKKTRETRLELSRSENRRLWDVVDEVAIDSGTKTVDRMWLAPDASVSVWEQGGLGEVLSGRAPRCLSVGLTAVHDMSVAEFKSILRHEFAHLSNRDTAWGAFTYSMERSILSAWNETPGGNPLKQNSVAGGIVSLNPAWWVYWLFVRLFFRSTAGFSRVRELTADWDAISYTGGECFAGGLTKVIVNDAVLQKWLRETRVREGEVPSVAGSVASMIEAMTPQQVGEARESALSGEGGPYAAYNTHPESQNRLDYARRAGGQAVGCSEEPVKGLFDAWDEVDANASRVWLTPQPA